MNDIIFGLVQVDIEAPEELKVKFSEMILVFQNTMVSRDDVEDHMKGHFIRTEHIQNPLKQLIGSYFTCNIALSLYSTATQNYGVGGWRWAITPDARILRWDTNMLVSENCKKKIESLPRQKTKNCVSPDAKPKRQPVEYRLRWVPRIPRNN